MSDITFKMTVATNVGLVRTNNEDNFIVNPDLDAPDKWIVPANADDVFALGKNGCVMVVADGMGGMNAGEVASEIAVNYVKQAFSKVSDFSKISDCSNHVEDFLKKIIVEADAAIKKKVKEDPSTSGMGTTIVVAWIIGEVVHVAWCGDSRAYHFNRQSGLSRLSKDHSYVQELVDAGKLDPELAFDHPNSNIITRSLGDSPVKAQPDYVCKRLSAGDYVILCTDGLCGLVRDERILEIMMQERSSLAEYKTALFDASFEEGAYDNVTIALFECMSVKEENIASTVAPGAPKSKKKKKSGSLGKKILVFVLLMIALAGIFMVSWHFDIITMDDQKNIHINIQHLDSLLRRGVSQDIEVLEDAADTAAVINNPDTTIQ